MRHARNTKRLPDTVVVVVMILVALTTVGLVAWVAVDLMHAAGGAP